MNLDDVIQQPGQQSRMLRDAVMDGLHVSVPGRVVSFDKSKGTATIQPTVRRFGKAGAPPLLVDVPVYFPGNYTFQVNPGDEALVVFADGCIDAWYQSGGVSAAMSARTHSLSDGFAFVGFRSNPNICKGKDLEERLLTEEDREKLDILPESFWSFETGTAIPEDSDLDDYTKAGNYRCESGSIANTIQNNPLGANPFVLKIFDAQEAGILIQWVIQGNGVRMFLRRYANGAFSDWARYTTDEATTGSSGYMSAADKTEMDAFAAYGVRAKTTTITNIDNILDAGVYWLASNVQSGGSWPVDISVGTRYAILEVIVGGGSGTVKIQRMTVYSTGIVYERIYANSQWYSWNCDVSLAYGYTIGANSNLNDYTDIGNFRVTQASVAATVANAPITNHGFLLKVMAGAMAGVTIQLAISGAGDTVHMRYKTGSVWTAWANYLTNNATASANGYMSSTDKGVLDTSAVRGSKAAPSGSTSLDQITGSGIYWLGSSNYPNGWPSQEGTGGKNALLVVFYDGGGARIQELTMYDGNGANRRYCRMYINSQWYAWRQISTGSGIAWSLDIGAQIAANSDLNNFKTPGSYTSPTNITPTLSHKPPTTSNAFILKVMVGHVANTVVQYAIDVTGSLISIRYFNTSSWGSWYKYTGTAV